MRNEQISHYARREAKYQVKSQEFLYLRDRIEESLRLENGIPEIREKTKDRMLDSIASGIVHSTSILGIRNPEVGLIAEWGSPAALEYYRLTTAGVVGEDYPKGIIFFGPEFLQYIADKEEGRRPKLNFHGLSLIGGTIYSAHRIYSQFKFPSLMDRDLENDHIRRKLLVRGEIKKMGISSRSDLSATLFQRRLEAHIKSPFSVVKLI